MDLPISFKFSKNVSHDVILAKAKFYSSWIVCVGFNVVRLYLSLLLRLIFGLYNPI